MFLYEDPLVNHHFPFEDSFFVGEDLGTWQARQVCLDDCTQRLEGSQLVLHALCVSTAQKLRYLPKTGIEWDLTIQNVDRYDI